MNPKFLFWLEIAGSAILAFVVYKILNKFNLFGDSEDTKDAKKLGTDPALANVVTNITKDPKNVFLIAIHKRFGKKPTEKQLNSLLPNKPNFPKWVTSINFDVHHTLSKNDSSIIFGIFKSMASQYEINFFSTVFSITTKQDMYKKLDKLMTDSDMAELRDVINSKPII